MSFTNAVIISLALAFFAAPPVFAKGKKKKAGKSASLFQRIGGKKAIAAVVDDFVGRCARDPKIKQFFAATATDPRRLKNFKKKLADQICQGTGGPCRYKGKSMKIAHRGMGVRDVHFNSLVKNLQASLDKFNVARSDKKKIVAILAPMRRDIVEGPSRSIASVPSKKKKSKKRHR